MVGVVVVGVVVVVKYSVVVAGGKGVLKINYLALILNSLYIP